MDSVIRSIIDGSDVLNRMRAEVALVITTLLSMVSKGEAEKFWETYKPKSHHESYPDGGTRFWGTSPETGEEFQWLIVYRGRFQYLEVILVRNDDGREIQFKSLGLKDVRLAHSALPRLVEAMKELFPGLEERWQPLVEAAPAPWMTQDDLVEILRSIRYGYLEKDGLVYAHKDFPGGSCVKHRIGRKDQLLSCTAEDFTRSRVFVELRQRAMM